jgi:hypothetical protein
MGRKERTSKVHWNSSLNISYANHAPAEGVASNRRNRKEYNNNIE